MDNLLIDPSQIDPSFEEWIASGLYDRFERLISELASPQLLAISGYLPEVVKYWVKYEIANEFIQNHDSWMKREGLAIIQQQENSSSLKQLRDTLSQELFHKKLLVGSASHLWAKEKWRHQIERLFLASANCYDSVDMEALASANSNLMTEVYYRLIDDDCNFKQVSEVSSEIEYSLFAQREVGTISKTITSALTRLKSRDQQITKPLKAGHQYIILNLISYKPAVLDEKLIDKLIGRQLEAWVDMISAKIIDMLAVKYFEKTSNH